MNIPEYTPIIYRNMHLECTGKHMSKIYRNIQLEIRIYRNIHL